MIFVDANVLIDVLEPDPAWAAWSTERLLEGRLDDVLVTSVVVVAECATHFTSADELLATFDAIGLDLRPPDVEAALVAGERFRRYRLGREGGGRVLPDFLIGAHALTLGATLLTRDAAIYRRHFPELPLITPDETHG